MSVFIIAEAGVNHNGKLDLAKKMVDKAKEAGADCIKFQTFVSKYIVSKGADKADYQKKQTGADESQLSMLKKLELSFNDFIELNEYCKASRIRFLSTAFDFNSIDFLNNLGMGMWKVPSGEITNLPYLIKIAKTHQPIIMSTGMSTLDEIQTAVDALNRYDSGAITLLHCTTEYPAPYTDVNLNAIKTMRDTLHLPVGYSDHTKGIEIPMAAVALGATVIEKHFTLDKNLEGPDHKASLEPDELASMVNAIRNVELAMGTGEKKPAECELKNMAVARKSIIASRSIKEGEVLSEDNLTVKRPGTGISPMLWFEVLGQRAIREFEEDELIEI
ncbi:N-acetylneuraminate synthase [Pelotomaculum propionicicum]|uniref:N-acetylneuraminate synthase n=1 Tax=Pelotomaculum propionicicum TaxID=258475 RepID=UPI003B775129